MEQSFQLKGSLFTLSVLQLLNDNLEKLDQQLAERIQLAPKFFQNAPIVIDLQSLNLQNSSIDFSQLSQILRKHTLIPVGVRGGNANLQTAAQAAGFATMIDVPPPTNKETAPADKEKKVKKPEAAPAPTRTAEWHSLLITQPVRSGQQIYAQGDLVIVSSVSRGAELLAEGNIHIYGTLRGRALAGINGNTDARIFCHEIEAELVSIAGQYKVLEENPLADHSGMKQIYLEDGQLLIRPL